MRFVHGCAGAVAAVLLGPPLSAQGLAPRQSGYEPRWEVRVASNTRLAQLKARLETRVDTLPPGDVQDRSPLPPWFRLYLRDSFPGLPTSGPYQYPHTASDMLEWMVGHPDFTASAPPTRMRRSVKPPGDPVAGENTPLPAYAICDVANKNAGLCEVNNESTVAQNPVDPKHLIVASNTRALRGSGHPIWSWRQKQFFTVDYGATWDATHLPLVPPPEETDGRHYHGDPSVAFSSDGTVALSSTLGFQSSVSGATVWLQVYKSLDKGATWLHLADVERTHGRANDKPMMWIDTHPTSPHKDTVYLAWNVLSGDSMDRGVYLAHSRDLGDTWSAPQRLSGHNATGVHLASGPLGEVYVAWPDTDSRKLYFRKTRDAGSTFEPPLTAAPSEFRTKEGAPLQTKGAYRTKIPAMEVRKPLTYLSLGVARHGATSPAPVYAAWTACDGATREPCTGSDLAESTKVYFTRSDDGGATWSVPSVPFGAPPTPDGTGTWDQFNQWMDVDPGTGTIHLVFYDTRDDPARKKTHLYYVQSRDGGMTWPSFTRVTDRPTDETDDYSAADQYGDYNGLVARQGAAVATWTDRRDPETGGAQVGEQIYTAVIQTWVLPECQLTPELCSMPEMFRGGVILKCARRPCLIVDYLPMNCLVKFECPVCKGGLCPSRFRITLDGLPSGWKVSLRGSDGERVPHALATERAGFLWLRKVRAVDFQPDRRAQRVSPIGDYVLTFEPPEGGKPGEAYRVGTSLRVID